MTVHLLWGVGAKGVLQLGTDRCSRKIGDEPINVTSFSFSEEQIFIGLWLSIDNFQNNYVIFKPYHFFFS
jgi:hypothetical protein